MYHSVKVLKKGEGRLTSDNVELRKTDGSHVEVEHFKQYFGTPAMKAVPYNFQFNKSDINLKAVLTTKIKFRCKHIIYFLDEYFNFFYTIKLSINKINLLRFLL